MLDVMVVRAADSRLAALVSLLFACNHEGTTRVRAEDSSVNGAPRVPAKAVSADDAQKTTTGEADGGESSLAPTGTAQRNVPPDWPPGTREAPMFQVMCSNGAPPNRAGDSMDARACTFCGRIRSLERTIAEGAGLALRAYLLELEPDDALACPRPLDEDAQEPGEPAANIPDRVRRQHALLIGAGRLESALWVGRGICGWSKRTRMPGLPASGVAGTEGSLSAEDGTLLAAWSSYFVPAQSRALAAHWSFAREGSPKVDANNEGGASVVHPTVRVRFDQVAISVRIDEERELALPPGSLLVRASSRLTQGRTPIFTGNWNGYQFAAVRKL
jgi:hypothetical protein